MFLTYALIVCVWFMQLNPARGRKHIARLRDKDNCISVYAAQPREGTETYLTLLTKAKT